MKVFNLWSEERNKSQPQDPVPANLLSCNDPMPLSKHLSRFAAEVRKTNRELYTPATIHKLLCGFLRHMRETSPGCPNFLDKIPDSGNSMALLMYISTLCTLMVLVDKSNIQMSLQRKTRSYGIGEYWVQTLQEVFRMQHSL